MADDLLYRVALTMIPGVGSITAKKLLAAFGSPQAVFDVPSSKLESILNTNSKNLDKNKILKQAEKELIFINSNNIRTLFYTDDDYPHRLNLCEDAPAILFVKGTTDFNNPKIISIVGTRNASNYGLSVCKKFVAELVEKGYKPLIVSGLAYGIDVCAHTAALSNGLDTVAVMGTPLNKIYPAPHENIARQIEKQGALVSEFATTTTVAPGNFVSRNRIIAGLADVTIIVESSKKGGALLTANLANSYNREVMAFPGRIGDEHSLGCNNLIKTHKAALLESVNDMEYLMNWSTKPKPFQKQIEFVTLTEPEQEILNLLKNRDSESIDAISTDTGIPIPELSAFLLNMEFAGLITVLPGNQYAIERVRN
ncbi:MAG: DNA-processing protein DprA [Prevotellaceae bacterium]|jgi:DNA processing protein|nr:DNA-processing protein DprA [Prevotellaceae bacterium]